MYRQTFQIQIVVQIKYDQWNWKKMFLTVSGDNNGHRPLKRDNRLISV